MALLSKGLAAELAHGEPCKILDGTGERPVVTSPLSLVKMEEHQRSNFHSELGWGGCSCREGGLVGTWFPRISWWRQPLGCGSRGGWGRWDPSGGWSCWDTDPQGGGAPPVIRSAVAPKQRGCAISRSPQHHGRVPPSPLMPCFASIIPPLEFERRQARPLDPSLHREEEGADFQQKMEETRQPPPRMRPVPSLVPRPPQTSLVKFVGNIYTLKCR